MKILETKVESVRNIKLALLGDSATQFFAKALKTIAAKENFALDIYESDYDQVERQILDTNSTFYKFNPTVVIVFNCTNKLLQKFYTTNEDNKNKFSDNYLKFVDEAYELINENLNCRTIFLNFNEYDNREYGNYASKTNTSFLFQLRQINMGLMYLAEANKNLFICDISYLVAQVGNKVAVDEKFYINSSLAFHPTFYSIIAKNIFDIINAFLGKFKKCLILDLDNTLWGGIIGDDGLEKIQIGDYKIGKAFSLVQHWAKQLKERGIILAVCSKNTESIAKEPFEKHPDIVLKLDDFAIFQANWETKVDNIRHIQEVLNIGFDSMVFLDDNPFERDIVKQNIPEITVPNLPEDPTLYLNYLRELNLFETTSVSLADKQRTEQYQAEAKRVVLKKTFASEAEYLLSLEMQCEVSSFNNFNLPRIAQLIQRSNQFNLRTQRFSEQELANIFELKNFFTCAFNLCDKFGDHGLICTVILEKKQDETLFINTWLMSCRVLKRGVENFVLNEIVAIAKKNNCQKIIGEYLPTPKNEIVKDHYKNLGFSELNSTEWILDVSTYNQKKSYINKKNN